MQMNKHLIVVAHADDEILGASGYIQKMKEKCDEVAVLIMTQTDPTREVYEPSRKVHEIEQIDMSYWANFNDSNFGHEKNLDLVKAIENCIGDFQPDYVLTHHPADNNPDHKYTSIACQQAVRYAQRQIYRSEKIKGFLYMEVNSATDWNINPSLNPISVNYYVSISQKQLLHKLTLVHRYPNVSRENPHPRSDQMIKAKAMLRGSECGEKYAEAFQIGFLVE